MSSGNHVLTAIEDGSHPLPFSRVPKGAIVAPRQCMLDRQSPVFLALQQQLKSSPEIPRTFETSQKDVSTKYGLTAAWTEQATDLWSQDSFFDKYVESQLYVLPSKLTRQGR